MCWGQKHNQWGDLDAEYGIKDSQRVFENVKQEVKECRKLWICYESHEEDKFVCKQKWNNKYSWEQVIVWDHKYMDFLFKPTKEESQRIT